ncbi:MAG TPA: dihydrofolate reductase [Puia sp.]|jgi:dihydrofolate reductase|nr:dihydrofolate reductase [Puia sp.]
MTISLIVAASTNNVIGKANGMVWNLPNDTKYFKNTTWGMPVIMGRKTYESMSSEPLPGRFNIVITRQRDWVANNPKVQVAGNLAAAIRLAEATDSKEAFVAGGGQIYAEALPLADKIYLTRVHAVVEGDAYFPEFDETRWEMISNMDHPADERHAYAYSFQVWQRKK